MIRSFVWREKALTWREKAYLIRVVDLPAQSGRRGSKPMGWGGQFALHLDYIAAELGAHPDTISDAQKGCLSKGYLTLVFPAAYGRPTTYQAQRCAHDVAVAKQQYETQRAPDDSAVTTGESRGVTNRQNTRGYENGDPAVTTGETPFLTYRGGTDPAPRPGRRLSRPDDVERASRTEPEESPRDVRAEVDRLRNEQEERTA